MDTDPILIVQPRKRGRPRVADPGIPLSARVPTPLYDQLVKAANQREQSVSSLVRSLLMMRVRQGNK